MKQLYPIGTKLTTERVSLAALYYEIFGDEGIETNFCVNHRYGPEGWDEGFVCHTDDDNPYCSISTYNWRVIVTEKNQKWVSTPQEYVKPDGTKAPLLEWDEVILPEQKG